jgi:hypothetical protein
MRALPLALMTLMGAAAACDEPAETPTPAEVEAPAETPADTPDRETVEAPLGDEAAEGLHEAGEAIGAAIRAGVAADGDSDCDVAYNGALAMIEQLRLQTGEAGEGTPPDRATFVASCESLPAPAQRCMVMSYALEHGTECRQWASDPRVQAMRRQVQESAAPAPE